jgi:hypothetical protein
LVGTAKKISATSKHDIGVEEVRFMDPLTEEEDAYTQRTANYFPLQEYLNFQTNLINTY